ncbi:FKBP-type 22 kDa peptidyl-prolyl cis-trans isomerase [Polystyrenella longa]|uniref:Peptidyl-prolyl cis-trans isomerase n=1 Tax=Polystyrenella longa TaxID=2528007 RepID=A0A518CM20_9PLAN|nr:FKBP-type peptidyl-prolyl cis-trans isomerase [Polystyrenella longa]QDU80243.1 FKBP-type 22 kDa peptidyl-prolyl cis-trans isomerase [Polystyrenella longa]
MRLFKLAVPLCAVGLIYAISCPLAIAQTKVEELKTLEDKAAYGIGYSIGKNLAEGGMTFDLTMFAKGVKDAFDKAEPPISETEIREAVTTYQVQKIEMAAEENKKAGEAFLAKNAKRKEVTTTESGLQYEVLKKGAGESPKATDKVKVHYHGTLTDGTVFDSSVDRGEPISFPLDGVIQGWTEGVQLMNVGSKFKFVIPGDLAYGENPRPGGPIGPNETLVFEVELLGIGE